MPEFDKAAHKLRVEQAFLVKLNEKLAHENAMRAASDEMLRLQGELRCLDAIPDSPQG